MRSFQTIQRRQREKKYKAVFFLARQNSRRNGSVDIRQVIDQLAQGNTARADAVLRTLSEESLVTGDDEQAAAIERHRAALAVLDNPKQAIAAYQYAAWLEPESWQGWSHLGYLLQRTGQHSQAKTAYENTLKLAYAADDRNIIALAYENLGTLFQVERSFKDAMDRYHRALSIYRERRSEEDLARTYTNLGNLYGDQGNFEKALACIAMRYRYTKP